MKKKKKKKKCIMFIVQGQWEKKLTMSVHPGACQSIGLFATFWSYFPWLLGKSSM